jgi:hypothetical protein
MFPRLGVFGARAGSAARRIISSERGDRQEDFQEGFQESVFGDCPEVV